MAELIKSDLEFILQQIQIAEAHAAGADLTTLLPNIQVPLGLRTVDGTFNHLVLGQSEFGAADTIFPRLTDPVFRNEGDDTFTFDANGPAPGGLVTITNNNYASTVDVVDADPRIITNLIVDQTPNNPAAVAAAAATPGAELTTSAGPDRILGTTDDTPVFFIPNIKPDTGLSAPFNPWFTFFGQFFDHGLDLITKGGSGTVFIPLQADDPLFNPGPDGDPNTLGDNGPNFMVLTRATNLAVHPGPDGMLGTADDIHDNENTTSPFVDQNQTYTSHPAHQVFLRAYEFNAAGDPVATGKLITNHFIDASGHLGAEIGGMSTWGVVKAQARDLLGIQLSDYDAVNVPLVRVDPYGNFVPGLNGFAQLIVGLGADGQAQTADDVLVEGNPLAPISPTTVGALRTGHQFLIDIAASANPFSSTTGLPLAPDGPAVDVLTPNGIGDDHNPATYDDELLAAHYIAGDGRVNENIGLTAVHHMFHAEHNRQVDQIKATILADATATGNVAFLNEWLTTDVAAVPADPSTLVWDGERLFQAAKFATEMQYQHLVFEEFARTMQPNVDAFLAPSGFDTTINPAIVAEFAHTIFRLGHSMLVESIDRLSSNFVSNDITLITAFLNPLAFAASGPTPEEAAGAIVRGLTRQVGNEIDEFVTEAVRNNLLGLPLDLAVLNITRGRDTGIPPLNQARREFFAMTGDSQLTPYTSWADFVQHLRHPESLVNFIAAYGTHPTITGAMTLADKRAAASLIVFGGAGEPTDRLEFLYSTGDWANTNPAHPKDVDGVTTTGLGSIDFWVGGIAEEQMPFGGLLGSTFNFVFETQLEALQDGDRFYYLARNAGLNFLTELENNSFAKLVMLNTDVTHLPASIFSTPAFILEVDQTHQFNETAGPDGILLDDPTTAVDESADNIVGNADPVGDSILLTPLVIRNNPATPGPDTNYLQYTGEDHIVLGGTPGNDIIVSSIGDDTLYGDAGNDRLEGGDGNDTILGGAGDDSITDLGGDDVIQGDDGNDVIHAGNSDAAGVNLILGGLGSDFIITTEDISEIFGGPGNDFLLGAKVNEAMTGNEGDDWIEKGTQDGAPGDNMNPFLADDVRGNDVFIGGGGFDEFIGEGGDDIFVGSDAQDKMDGMSGFDWVSYKNDKFGVTVDLTLAALGGVGEVADHIALPLAASPSAILDRFAEVEGLSGSAFGDILRGDDVNAVTIVNHGGATGGVLTNIALINGLQDLLGASAASFGTGNIILGGDGSDLIEGRGGDDLIDGDRWLNVRISVRANLDGTGPEIRSANSMTELVTDMLAGKYNPGQLQIVREIMPGNGGFDTANFSGNLADYTIAINDNGTPANLSDDIVTVTDNSVKPRDGIDTLKHIERLQFADQAVVLPAGAGLNAAPVGLLEIRDAATNTPDNTPTEGQLLRVSKDGVTDANNVSLTNLTGAITSSVSYVWQVERDPGTGVFEDIINLPAGDLAFQSANGTTFRVTPDLAGLVLRVKGIYQDAHGVLEQVFSAPTAPVIDVPNAPPAPPAPAGPDSTAGGPGLHLIRTDLAFILDQIRIAEHHAAGEDLLSLLPNVRGAFGLRTVDGSFNNLINFGNVQQNEFGAADNVFPRLLDPVFRSAEKVTVDLDGPGPLTVGTPTSYQQTSGFVFDSQPRIISNLIGDQTANNPAAVAAAAQNPGAETVFSPGLDKIFGTADDREVFLLPNVAPDVGLSAPFNLWFVFFGQFFDHGLDLVQKGGSGTVFMPLQADDPLVAGADGIFGNADDLPPELRFMVLTRATNRPGPDGILGTADDIHEHLNQTSPFVDQNQTYTSHPAHQVFLRAYELDTAGHPVATGKLIVDRDLGAEGIFGNGNDTVLGGMATWGVVKAQTRDFLGIQLSDYDAVNVPLVAVDLYGNFRPGPNGFAQLVLSLGPDGLVDTPDDVLIEGNPLAPISPTAVGALRTGQLFLADIAHIANPFSSAGAPLAPDADLVAGADDHLAGTYDDELLARHFMAGDGRVNENIALTTVHHMFHAEHNRQAEDIKATILASGDVAFLNEWLRVDVLTVPTLQADIDALQWDGERLFQAAKFATEMQYQHLVFEEFARTVQPMVDPFFAPTQVYDAEINPAIVAEFAHTVYRFGHSMLLETIDRRDPNFASSEIGLIAAFLNPLAFNANGTLTPEEAAGAIVRGTTRQVGNEIDEFKTEAMRNNLLGLPLDLGAINMARGRDTGIPSLNAARREFYSDTGDSQLKPYTSWADFVQHMRHPESLINFIAAYGTHDSVANATTLAGKRSAATLLVLGDFDLNGNLVIDANEIAPADRLAFLNSTGVWASSPNGVTTTGLDNVDFWIGGMAEEQMPFGGLLGSTFNFVFENQLEKLQDGDRFYYLERTAGLNFNTELENNSFAKLIMANTNATHLPGVVFKTPSFTFEVDQTHQFTGLGDGRADPVGEGPFATLIPLVIRDNPTTVGPDTNYLQYTGEDHVVLGGTAGHDIIRSSIGDDTLYGDAGNDRLDGGDGNDITLGGPGDDIITDTGGDDTLQGGDGNDVIHGGNGLNLILGGFGNDFIVGGEDSNETFGGPGNDFILGTKADEQNMGNEGDDWLEAGTSDGAPGDNFDPLGNDPIAGNDVYIGRGENDKFNAEGGDDIMVGSNGLGDRYIGGSGYDWVTFKDDAFGVTIDFIDRFFDQPPVPGSGASALARFDIVEGLSGSAFGDVLSGDDVDAAALAVAGAQGSVLTNIALIKGPGPDGIQGTADDGLQGFLNDMLGTPTTPVVTFFDGGNIILGGDGSDIIEGRGGDDLIDGDAWLNVRISVRSAVDPSIELTSADSMTQLVDAMVTGIYSPGQLQIVRELLYAAGPDFDTAKFSGDLAEYTVAIDTNGTPDFNDDIVTVSHILDGLPGPDGTDTLRHIERLQFADQAIVLGGLNAAPVGSLTILDTNGTPLDFNDDIALTNPPSPTPPPPTEDHLLRVSIAGVTDANNVVIPTNPTGAISPPVAYFWQSEVAPGVFEDILVFGAGEAARVEGETFRPGDLEVGVALRVRAVYKDANGVLEEVFSAATAPVANVNDPPVGAVLISDTTPTETLAISARNAFTDADGLPTVFIYQWQQANATGVGGGAAGFSNITGATAQTFTPGAAQVNSELRVVVTYTDLGGTLETVTSAATTVTGDFIPANAAAQTLTGTEGQDIILGGGGADQLNGLGEDDLLDGGTGDDLINAGAGNDTLTGGGGADTLNGDAGNDTFAYTMGDGADTVNGGADLDALTITGTAGNDTLDVVYNGTALTNFENGTIINVEAVTANLLGQPVGGSDALSYAGTTANVTVNLAAGSASGFVAIAGIENVTGGSGNDTLTGDANANTLNGGLGDDTFIATVGDGNDSYNGGGNGVAGDTYDLSHTSAGAIVTTTSASSADTGADLLGGIENIIGSQGNDTITGGAGANNLDGQGGDDTLNGGGGSDVLSGGLGADTLSGGTGNDTLTGGFGNDTFNYTMGDGTDTVDGGSGFDTLNITGTTGNDTLDVVYNGTALTSVEGGAVTGVEAVTANLLGQLVGGRDTLSYAGTTANVTVNLATGTASGFAAIADIENVTGGSGDDTLTGSAGPNTLTGGAGNDTLDGNGGTDTLVGNAGDDLFITDGGDTLTEAAGGGTDTVQSSVSFTLAAQFENLTLTGVANLNGTGNGVANIITGNDGNNTLLGLGGNDTLSGGLGNDTLNGGANAAGGSDTLTGSAGDDTFVFGVNIAEAGNGAGTRDVITDFQGAGVAGGDVIDVNAIDANTGVAGNQNFTFLSTAGAAFTAAGQLRYVQVGGITIIEGNVNANLATVDFQIELTGTHNLVAADFNL